jgi:nitrite reductase/ring-hydroxylating ferredoxin subunit
MAHGRFPERDVTMTDQDVNPSDVAAGTTRRNVLLGAGAVGALGVLAACGGDGGTGGGTTTPPGAPTTASTPEVIKTEDIPVGSGKVIKTQNVVVTQPAAGNFKAFDATCRHMGCQVGSVTSTINCPCHGSRYSIQDGSVVNGPTTQPLPAKTVNISGDIITVS